MCAYWGSSFQWFMGMIGHISTRVNRPNDRCSLGATGGIIEKKTCVAAYVCLLEHGRLIGIKRYLTFTIIVIIVLCLLLLAS